MGPLPHYHHPHQGRQQENRSLLPLLLLTKQFGVGFPFGLPKAPPHSKQAVPNAVWLPGRLFAEHLPLALLNNHHEKKFVGGKPTPHSNDKDDDAWYISSIELDLVFNNFQHF